MVDSSRHMSLSEVRQTLESVVKSAQWSEASDIVQFALATYPDDGFSISHAGIIMINQGELEQGCELASRGLGIDPLQPRSFYDEFMPSMCKASRQDQGEAVLRGSIDVLTRGDLSHPSQIFARRALAEYLMSSSRHADYIDTVVDLVTICPDQFSEIKQSIIRAFVAYAEKTRVTPISEAVEAFGCAINKILRCESPADCKSMSIPAEIAAVSFVVFNFQHWSVGDDEVKFDAVLKAAGISSAFADLVKKGARAMASAVRACLPSRIASDRVSDRIFDILNTLDARRKPAISPYTGSFAFASHMVAEECFLLREQDRNCIISQWAETETAYSDTIWIFPFEQLTIRLPEARISLEVLLDKLSDLFYTLFSRRDEFIPYLNSPVTEVGITQFDCPHLAHYIWNCVSGWSPLFRLGGLPDFYVVMPSIQFCGGVGELFQEMTGVQPSKIVEIRNYKEITSIIIARRAMVHTIKHNWIDLETATRLTSWGYNNVTLDFKRSVLKFSDRAAPILLFNVRLDNRAWKEQEEGWLNLARASMEFFPQVGVILDGINRNVFQGWTHAFMSLSEEVEFGKRLEDRLSKYVLVFNSIGCSMAESLVLGDAADMFVGHFGAGMAKYRWVSNVPGVVFSNKEFSDPTNVESRLYDGCREGVIAGLHVNGTAVVNLEERHGQFGRANFSMKWEDLHEVCKRAFADFDITARASARKQRVGDRIFGGRRRDCPE